MKASLNQSRTERRISFQGLLPPGPTNNFPRRNISDVLAIPDSPLEAFDKLRWVFFRMIPDEFYQHIALMTDESIKAHCLAIYRENGPDAIRSLRGRQLLGLARDRPSAGGNRPSLTIVEPGSADEIKRLFFASLLFQTLHSSYTAQKYFTGCDAND